MMITSWNIAGPFLVSAAEGGEVPERSCDHSRGARHRPEEDHAVEIFVMSAATGIREEKKGEECSSEYRT